MSERSILVWELKTVISILFYMILSYIHENWGSSLSLVLTDHNKINAPLLEIGYVQDGWVHVLDYVIIHTFYARNGSRFVCCFLSSQIIFLALLNFLWDPSQWASSSTCTFYHVENTEDWEWHLHNLHFVKSENNRVKLSTVTLIPLCKALKCTNLKITTHGLSHLCVKRASNSETVFFFIIPDFPVV